ncbi:MAG: hypothetical protein AAGK78_16690 [Planctomycetota bacterium]
MAKPPPFDDEHAVHRWFAVECNNAAWDLLEADALSSDQVTQLLDVAHASRWHWYRIGTPLQKLRADLLIAAAYWRTNQPTRSLIYLEHAAASLGDATDFDRVIWGRCAIAIASAAGLGTLDRDRVVRASSIQLLPEEEVVIQRVFGA